MQGKILKVILNNKTDDEIIFTSDVKCEIPWVEFRDMNHDNPPLSADCSQGFKPDVLYGIKSHSMIEIDFDSCELFKISNQDRKQYALIISHARVCRKYHHGHALVVDIVSPSYSTVRDMISLSPRVLIPQSSVELGINQNTAF